MEGPLREEGREGDQDQGGGDGKDGAEIRAAQRGEEDGENKDEEEGAPGEQRTPEGAETGDFPAGPIYDRESEKAHEESTAEGDGREESGDCGIDEDQDGADWDEVPRVGEHFVGSDREVGEPWFDGCSRGGELLWRWSGAARDELFEIAALFGLYDANGKGIGPGLRVSDGGGEVPDDISFELAALQGNVWGGG